MPDPQVSFTMFLPQSLRDAAQTHASAQERPLAWVFRRALAAYIAVDVDDAYDSDSTSPQTPELPFSR